MRPRLEEELVRLRVWRPHESAVKRSEMIDNEVIKPNAVEKRHASLGDKILLWKGPKEEILQQGAFVVLFRL